MHSPWAQQEAAPLQRCSIQVPAQPPPPGQPLPPGGGAAASRASSGRKPEGGILPFLYHPLPAWSGFLPSVPASRPLRVCALSASHTTAWRAQGKEGGGSPRRREVAVPSAAQGGASWLCSPRSRRPCRWPSASRPWSALGTSCRTTSAAQAPSWGCLWRRAPQERAAGGEGGAGAPGGEPPVGSRGCLRQDPGVRVQGLTLAHPLTLGLTLAPALALELALPLALALRSYRAPAAQGPGFAERRGGQRGAVSEGETEKGEGRGMGLTAQGSVCRRCCGGPRSSTRRTCGTGMPL